MNMVTANEEVKRVAAASKASLKGDKDGGR